MKLRVLIACEFSGVVREAFAARGWHAVSCDLRPTTTPGLHAQCDVRLLLEGWEPVHFSGECDPDGDGWCQVTDRDPNDCDCYGPTQDGIEYHDDLGRPRRHRRWDLLIAHPPCTYLTGSAEWAYTDGPYHQRVKPGTLTGAARRAAREEAAAFALALWQAPIRHIALENPVGHLATAIRPADQSIQPYEFGHDASKRTCLWLKNLPALVGTATVAPRMVDGKPRWGNQTDSGQNRLSPSEGRASERSLTYQGIADAMADQWTRFIRKWRTAA